MKIARQNKIGKYFSHILFSYFCFILVSLISAVVIYQISYRQMIQQTSRSDYAAFEQFYKIIDQELNNAANKVDGLQRDPDLLNLLDEEFTNGGISPYSSYLVKRKMQMISNSNLTDLFIYLPQSDRIISGYYATLSAKYYFSTYYNQMSYSDSFFTVDEPRELLPITTSMGQKTVAIRMPIFISTYYSGKNMTYSVFSVLNPTRIKENMDYLEQSTSGNIMILNSDNQVLIRSSLLSEIDPSAISLEEGIQQTTLNGLRYAVFVKSSTVTTYRYVSFIPLAAMNQSLSFFRLYSIINVISVFLFGIILAFLLTKVNYKPVARLLESAVSLNDKEHFTGAEEFKYLEDSIKTAISDKTRYTSDLSEFRQARKYNLVLNLINGIVPAGSTADHLFAELGESLLSEQFAVMLFDIEEWNDNIFSKDSVDERPMLSKIILPNVIEELCNEKNKGFVVNINSDRFVCIVNLSVGTSCSDLKAIAEHSLRFLNDVMGILCTAGIGNCYGTLKEIRSSYNEALRAEEYKIVLGTGQVLCYQDLFALATTDRFLQDSSIRMMLMQGIKDDNADCSQVYHNIFTHCFSSKLPGTPESARGFIFDLCVQANDILSELDTQNNVALSDYHFDLNIETYKTIDNFRDYFIHRMQEIRQVYRERHSVKILGQSIQEFIESHYADMNLGVNEIGRQFNFTPAYCSKIFRQETNQGITESISAVRIKKACEKLIETDDNLDTIAQRCGFTSSAVFIRSFKKICGITPGSYRKIMRK